MRFDIFMRDIHHNYTRGKISSLEALSHIAGFSRHFSDVTRDHVLMIWLRDFDWQFRDIIARVLRELNWQPVGAQASVDMAYLLVAERNWEAVKRLGFFALPAVKNVLNDDNP